MLGICLLVLVTVVFGLWIRWRTKKFQYFKKLGIPGPEPSIFFGNVIEMMRKDPMTCHGEWVKKYGSVLGYYYGSWPVLLVSDPDLMKQVLIKDFSSFADRPSNMLSHDGDSSDQVENQHMINLKGKRWKEVRNMLTPAFTTGKLRQMIPLMDESANVMLSKVEAASRNGTNSVDVYPLFQRLAMDVIAKSAFGIESAVQNNPKHPLLYFVLLLRDAKFKSLLNLLLVSFREFHFFIAGIRRVLYMMYGGGKDPLSEIFRISGDVVKLRRENPSTRRPDLLQTIIDARLDDKEISEESLIASAEGQDTLEERPENVTGNASNIKILRTFSDTEVTANAFLFFIVGFETTSISMTFLAYNLLRNPDIQEKVRNEIFEVAGKSGPISYDQLNNLPYTDRVIMESLRIHPSVYNFQNRVCNREVMLGKWKIPVGTTIQIPVWSLHFNPKNFEDPYTFNPDRFLPENRGKDHSVTWQPFGAGPRNCIGMRFALLEMKATIVKLLRKYRLEPSEKTERKNLKLQANIILFHPASGIHLKAVPI